jgi:hypothetical protein
MTTWTTEDLENAKKKIEEDEYSGGIPIPFAGWVQQDKEDTEAMLRHQLQILQAEIERLIGAEPITYGMLTFCKKCGEQNPYFEKAQEK